MGASLPGVWETPDSLNPALDPPAWFFLTIGNIVGAWWAVTLGWGGLGLGPRRTPHSFLAVGTAFHW
jgi:hypothetical protein